MSSATPAKTPVEEESEDAENVRESTDNPSGEQEAEDNESGDDQNNNEEDQAITAVVLSVTKDTMSK